MGGWGGGLLLLLCQAHDGMCSQQPHNTYACRGSGVAPISKVPNATTQARTPDLRPARLEHATSPTHRHRGRRLLAHRLHLGRLPLQRVTQAAQLRRKL